MITAIRIENLRSLKDTGFIQIKPLTVLLGANSSGKSTFLRSFLLFAQSVNKKLRGPISWFDDAMVDFGDFQTAVNREAKEKGDTIRFSYKMDNTKDKDMRLYEFERRPRSRKFFSLEASISFVCDSGGTYINEITIQDDTSVIRAFIENRNSMVRFEVDGVELEMEEKLKWNFATYHSILPTFEHRSKENEKKIGQITMEAMTKFVGERCSNKLRNLERIEVLSAHSRDDKKALLNYLKNNFPIKSFSNYVVNHNWKTNSHEFLKLYGYLCFVRFLGYLPFVDRQLTHFYDKSSYIAPARAEGNRYYRTQGFQISDIDPYGRNLQEFISSLEADQKASYQDFMRRILGLVADTVGEEGHHSIVLSSEIGTFNLADVGFGYSQILPIITKLWYITEEHKRFHHIDEFGFFFVESPTGVNSLMEQPELHLHPAYQAKIADAFISTIEKMKGNDRQANLIVETHSETIINRIGRRIREKVLDPDDVNVVIFNKTLLDDHTTVEEYSYNDNGQIKNWPFGFFDPDKD
jgi:AAA15 family ATPase/GTPase